MRKGSTMNWKSARVLLRVRTVGAMIEVMAGAMLLWGVMVKGKIGINFCRLLEAASRPEVKSFARQEIEAYPPWQGFSQGGWGFLRRVPLKVQVESAFGVASLQIPTIYKGK
jgi:hypothetical protein